MNERATDVRVRIRVWKNTENERERKEEVKKDEEILDVGANPKILNDW